MFQFNRVLNATTGERYTICEAVLVSEEIDDRPDGVNSYEIGLEPENPEGMLLQTISLSIYNSGAVLLTRNLDPKGSTREAYSEEFGQMVAQETLDDVIIEGKTLIITMKPCQKSELTMQSALTLAEYYDNMSDAIEALLKAWDVAGITPKEQVLHLQKAFPEILPKLPSSAFLAKEG